jgi:hypothetical protein
MRLVFVGVFFAFTAEIPAELRGFLLKADGECSEPFATSLHLREGLSTPALRSSAGHFECPFQLAICVLLNIGRAEVRHRR